jgi:hypothetical protein
MAEGGSRHGRFIPEDEARDGENEIFFPYRESNPDLPPRIQFLY